MRIICTKRTNNQKLLLLELTYADGEETTDFMIYIAHNAMRLNCSPSSQQATASPL